MTTLVLAMKLTIVFAVAGLITAAIRRGRAAARHLVWGLALGSALALPFLGFVSPRVELAVLPADPTPVVEVAPADPAPTGPARSVVAADVPAPVSPAPAPATSAAPLDIPWLLVIWVTGSVIFALLVLASVLATARLARRTTEIDSGALRAELDACLTALDIRRPVRLLRSHDQVMPMTWGARRPTVLLPAAAAEWSPERRRDVYLHELAHVQRYDWLSQLGARLACAAYWWHPLAWYAAKQMREERELACDDLVIAHGTNPADYAHHLLAIAKDLRASPTTALAAVAMARPSQLAGRLLAALDATRRRSGVSRAHAGAAVTATATLMLPLAGLTAVSARINPPVGPAAIEAPAVPATRAATVAPTTSTAIHIAAQSTAPLSLPGADPFAASTLCQWNRPSEQSS